MCAFCAITQPGGGGACQRCGRPLPDPASDLLQRLQARGVNFFLGEYDFRYQTSSEDLRQAVEGNRDAILRALRREAENAAHLSLEDPIKPFLSPAGCMALVGILYLCAVAAMWLWSRLA